MPEAAGRAALLLARMMSVAATAGAREEGAYLISGRVPDGVAILLPRCAAEQAALARPLY